MVHGVWFMVEGLGVWEGKEAPGRDRDLLGQQVRCVVVTEAGSYLRLIDFCITQLKAQGPSRICNESKEEEKKTAGYELPPEGGGCPTEVPRPGILVYEEEQLSTSRDVHRKDFG